LSSLLHLYFGDSSSGNHPKPFKNPCRAEFYNCSIYLFWGSWVNLLLFSMYREIGVCCSVFFFFKSTSVSYNLCTICIILNKWSYEFSQMYMWAVHWQNQSHNQDEKLSHYLPTFPMGPFAIHPSAPDSFMSAFHGYKLVLPVLELQINRIIQCGLFWVWLLLVRMSRDSSTLLGSAPDQDSSVCF
jgi:hypothetical protein